MNKIILKKGREKSLLRYHPWVFSGAIESIDNKLNEGEIVSVYDNNNSFLALGHYQPDSISVRILSFTNQAINFDFWYKRLKTAYLLRQDIFSNKSDCNVFRLVHGEGDSLPGLIIDIYNKLAVVQCHSAGMYLARSIIAQALMEIKDLKLDAVYCKSLNTMPPKCPIKVEDGFLHGSIISPIEVEEYGNKFLIDFVGGQKTGFFIDQRENRRLLSDYSKNKVIANMFSYTGGFSVYALSSGAAHVDSIDSSKTALELANKNAIHNSLQANHNIICMDLMKDIATLPDNYDIIVVDPPAFAKHIHHQKTAIKAYTRLNTAAIQKLKKGGLLFTFSCSQAISRSDFRTAIFSASVISGRQISVIHNLSQPADHPVNIYHPEGEYLKGLVMRVGE